MYDPLQSEITRINAEIDQLVYKLYGLTEEEIKIVKGNKKNDLSRNLYGNL